MRGVTYDYDFMKPDKTYLSFTDQSMPELLANIRRLTKTHYDLELKISRDTIYNIIHRPEVAYKFYASKISIKKINKPVKKEMTIQSQSDNITTNELNVSTTPQIEALQPSAN